MKKMIMLMTLIMSTIMIMSSNNWFSMWMGLEINMMSFIPLIEEKNKLLNSSAKMNYFLIQSLSSMVFLFNMIFMLKMKNMENMINMFMTMTMIMKMGAAPVHMWFIDIIKKISWSSCMILMTWQKIAPMYIMNMIMPKKELIIMLSLMSAIISTISGINQKSTKKILAFSSINHMSWMMMSILISNEMWMKYLMIYSIMIIMTTNMFSKNSMNWLNQTNIKTKSIMEKINMMFMMMSLGGLPPFLGFMMKWMMIEMMIMNNMYIMTTILILSSMITLFYYLRMIMPMMLMYSTTYKWSSMKKNNNFINEMMVNLTLPLVMYMNMI